MHRLSCSLCPSWFEVIRRLKALTNWMHEQDLSGGWTLDLRIIIPLMFVVLPSSAAFLTQTVCLDDTTVKFEIWDTAGQERYHSLAPMYYRGAQAAIVVYDITNTVGFTCKATGGDGVLSARSSEINSCCC